MRKLWPSKVKGSRMKKKPPNITKADFQTSKKILACYSVAIRVPR
jgi:hypothetical protein